jgi:4-amino-4-deoxy-L-arabinose transferase-like glycosyltransferase
MRKQKSRKGLKTLGNAAGFSMKVHDVELQARKVQNISGCNMVRAQGVAILIIIFFLAFAPLLSSTARYRGDESFYTDAAIRMVQTGDYLTPYYYDGTPRLRKPIFIYWVLAASYKIFGINLFSSRIPFLIAGCLVIWLTYKLYFLFFRRAEGAVIAAAIIASNLTLFHVSVRSTPDAFLCLFISVSLYGFARLIFKRDRRTATYIFAYVGAGLAAATKGGWGVLPVIFSFSFCFLRKGAGARPRDLIDVKSIGIAVFIALSWYAVAYYRHGDLFVQQFFGDQVGTRFSGSKWYIVENMFTYSFAIVRDFLPWSFIFILLLVARRDKDMISHFFSEHREGCIFILGWYISLCLIFLFGNIDRARFLLPAYPLVSALYAALLVPLASYGKGLSSSVLRHIERITLTVCLLFGLALAVAGMFIDALLIAGGILTVLVAAVLYATVFRRRGIYGLVTVSVCIILLFSITENFVSRVIYSSPATHVVRTMREHVKGPIEIAAVDLSVRYLPQINVLSGGQITVYVLESDMMPDKLKQFKFIVVSETFKKTYNPDGYTVQECGYSYQRRQFKTRSLLRIRTVGDLRRLILGLQQRYYLLIKSESPQR